MKAFKQALDYGLILEQLHRIIEFNQEAWLRSHIDMSKKQLAKAQKRFLEGLLKAHEHFSFQKVSGKCKKALRHQTCGE